MAEGPSDPEVKVKKHDRLQTYEAFWPHYLKEHSKDKTRYLHYLGSSLAIASLAGVAYTKNPRLLLAIPLAGMPSAAHYADASDFYIQSHAVQLINVTVQCAS